MTVSETCMHNVHLRSIQQEPCCQKQQGAVSVFDLWREIVWSAQWPLVRRNYSCLMCWLCVSVGGGSGGMGGGEGEERLIKLVMDHVIQITDLAGFYDVRL